MKNKYTLGRFISQMKKSIGESANSMLLKSPQWPRVCFWGIMVFTTVMLMAISTTYQVQNICQDTHILSDTECIDTEINTVSPQNFSEAKYLISTKEISYTTDRMGFSFAGIWDFLLAKFNSWSSEEKPDEHEDISATSSGIADNAGSVIIEENYNLNGIQDASEKQGSSSMIGCNCTDYLYLNDDALGVIHKFEVNADGSVAEIGSPWFDATVVDPNVSPHGIAADINGLLYISRSSNPNSPVMQLACDGTLIESGAFRMDDFTFNFFSANGILYSPGNFNDVVFAYDLCTGDEIGRMAISNGNDTDNWGFYIDDQYWYVPDRNSNCLYRGLLDVSLYDAAVSNSGELVFCFDNTIDDFMGMTVDDQGNYYFIAEQNFNATENTLVIAKYDALGNFVSLVNNDGNQGNNINNGEADFWGARGITYSATSGMLYVSNYENCISVFDTDLNQLSTFNVGNSLNGSPKGIGILNECCPIQSSVTIDTTFCIAEANANFFLQDFIACEGTVCEGAWQEGIGNVGTTYNDCNNSITVNSTGCNTFTKSSDGLSGQCGAFDINITVCISVTPNTPTIIVTDNDCANATPGEFTVVTPCDVGSTIEWSTNGGITWSTTTPTYDSTNAQTVIARCVDNGDNACVSTDSSPVTSSPVSCCPDPNCFGITIQ